MTQAGGPSAVWLTAGVSGDPVANQVRAAVARTVSNAGSFFKGSSGGWRRSR